MVTPCKITICVRVRRSGCHVQGLTSSRLAQRFQRLARGSVSHTHCEVPDSGDRTVLTWTAFTGNSGVVENLVRAASWTDRLPDQQKSLYRNVMRQARLRGLRFAVGGGFANNVYTGGW